jgi:hypothetical protein
LNVVVPYVELSPELPAALERDGISAVFVETSAPDGYWAMLAEQWARGETFIVLEQDKVPVAGALHELWNCTELWCTYPVGMRGTVETSPYPSLSCTKFHRHLIELTPSLLEHVGTLDLGLGEKEWSRLDLGIAGLLATVADCHWHDAGKVQHLH